MYDIVFTKYKNINLTFVHILLSVINYHATRRQQAAKIVSKSHAQLQNGGGVWRPIGCLRYSLLLPMFWGRELTRRAPASSLLLFSALLLSPFAAVSCFFDLLVSALPSPPGPNPLPD
jgi:hypothetical protein